MCKESHAGFPQDVATIVKWKVKLWVGQLTAVDKTEVNTRAYKNKLNSALTLNYCLSLLMYTDIRVCF